MTRQQKIAHALQKLRVAQRYVREAEKELRKATTPEPKPKVELTVAFHPPARATLPVGEIE